MSHRGACARNPRSGVHASGSVCRACAFGCATASGARVPIRAPRTWMGATRVFRCPVRASRRVGMCTSRTPSAPGRSRPSVPCGKAIEPAFRGRLRNRNVGVNVEQGRRGRPVASDHKRSSANRRGHGDTRRSERRVDGERLLRRLEAALDPLPGGISGAGATRRGGGARV